MILCKIQRQRQKMGQQIEIFYLQKPSNNRTIINSVETVQPKPEVVEIPQMGGGEKKLKKQGEKTKKSPSPCQSSRSSSESDNKEDDSVIHKKVRIISKAEESRWKIPEDMTKHANKFFQKYNPENNLEKMSQNTIQLPRTQADQKM